MSGCECACVRGVRDARDVRRREKVSDCERQRKNGVIRSCGERKELQEYKIKILSSDFPNFPNPLSTNIMLFLIIGNV